MKELIVASTNQGKLKEIRAMLKDINIEAFRSGAAYARREQ